MRTTPVGWLWSPLIALQFLTRIPIRFIPDSAYDVAGGRRAALVFFPLVGVVVGGIGALVCIVARRAHLPPLACAVLPVTVTAMMTGAFHEDGLADTADALGPHTRERALEVMRDSRIGTFGAVALWALLTLKVAALAALPSSLLWRVLIAAHMLARWSSLSLARALPYAQETKGLGANLASLAGGREITLATLLTGGTLLLLVGMPHALMLTGMTIAVMLLTGIFYRSRFGGVTGDCLGATNQIVEVAVLLTVAVFIHGHPHL